MTGPRCTVALLALLFLSFSFAVPAENLMETSYDESEGLLYVGSSSILNLAQKVTASTNQTRPTTESAVASIRTPIFDIGRQGSRSPQTRSAQALLCTFLC
jgi:hypothetical protein